MKLHILQHVPFEGPGYILDWAENNHAEVSYTRFYQDYTLPNEDTVDLIIILGGSMSVNQEAIYPWLSEEVAFINKCILRRIPVLGICLGAQLIAKALGAEVRPAKHIEIGWFPVNTRDKGDIWPWSLFDDSPVVLHWHGEQFEIPPGGNGNLFSHANNNQGFIVGDKIVGLQFHLEATADWVESLLEHSDDALATGNYIMNERQIRCGVQLYTDKTHVILHKLIDHLVHYFNT